MVGLDDALRSERMSHCHSTTTSGGGNYWADRRTEAGSDSRLALTGDGAKNPASSLVHHDPQLLLAGSCRLAGAGRHLAQARHGLGGPFPGHLLQSVHRVRKYFLVVTKEEKTNDKVTEILRQFTFGRSWPERLRAHPPRTP